MFLDLESLIEAIGATPIDQPIIITGATASGKSSLACQIAAILSKVAIINCDSQQIYQNLPILTNQPSSEQTACYEHLLYSVVNPLSNRMSVAWWL
ncbi:MAG: hypothetical protein AAF153_01830, partial [Pseudomonadota bacterium]